MKGTIYLMSNSVDDKIYIGSTAQRLSQRLYQHRAKAKSGHESNFYKHVRKVGVYNWEIEAIKICKVSSRVELERFEFECMKLYSANLLLNMNTSYRRMSKVTCNKMSVCQRGNKTSKFKRGTIGKFICTRNGVKATCIKFRWMLWVGDIGTRKSKSFSFSKYGERGARKMAERFRDTIYPPKTE